MEKPALIEFSRRPTRPVKVGTALIGGTAPISVQSMTNVPTRDVEACLEQIGRMVREGCEIVRVAVPTPEDTAALKRILPQVKVPVVADVHFHYARALEAIEAGVAKIRLNPGNIKDRRQVEEVIAACKANGTAIRVGVNEGSIRDSRASRVAGHESESLQPELVALMVEKMADYVRIFEENSFANLVLSAKCHDAATTIAVNRALSQKFDYPLHLGVTHAGLVETGAIRSAAALGALLAEGIGDTVRISLAGDPEVEIQVAWEILTSLGLRERNRPELIVCPTCGRTEIDILGMAHKVRQALADIRSPITVAVMGCVVNGPGEAAEADVALCGGRKKAAIYRHGEKVATVPEEQALEKLMEQVQIVLTSQTR